ncbi:MAG: hypothetical protein ACOC05_03250 [Oceanicaulis sp.]
MTPAFAAFLSAAALAAAPPPTGSAEVYAQRVALVAADTACAVFSRAERALLDALAARSRDDAARAGDTPAELDRFEARHRRAPETCNETFAGAAGHREHAAALAQTHEIAFPGLYQDWISERRHRNAPLWRVRQAARGHAAMLGVHAGDGDTGDGLAFAVRSESAPASAVLIARDPSRQPHPLDFTAGGLLPAPFEDALSAWGGAADAERRIPASKRLDAALATRLAPASGEAAYAFGFPDHALEALRRLAPREGVRIELTGARGELLDIVWFEAGMFNAAMAVQALPLPEPENTQTASAD